VIPYTKGAKTDNTAVNELYSDQDFSDYTGDICSFLTGGSWRIPSLNEFGSLSNYTLSTGTFSINAAGTGMITRGWTYNAPSFGAVFFPASGSRGMGGESYVGISFNNARYWSGSSYGEGHARTLSFGDNDIRFNNETYREEGVAVRCIKN
jgi:uncharacterized protein (TIGR02145 family)